MTHEVEFLNSLTRLLAALTELARVTSPWGPLIFILFPAILCLLMRRIGFAVMSGMLAGFGYAMAALPAGAGTAGALMIAASWAMLIPAHAAAHREHLAAQARQRMDALADQLNRIERRGDGAAAP